MKNIYLDYAATTPIDPLVRKVMVEHENFANPGSLHQMGQSASADIFAARRGIGEAINCHYSEIVFTGSATEANNLALRGAVKDLKKSNIVISNIEHESVIKTAEDLGVEVKYISAPKSGVISPKEVVRLVDKNTVLVSVMYVNNEIGSIQDIKKIAKLVKEKNSQTIFHTDAVQAFNYLGCDVQELGVDLMTLSAHKIYGPKGIGLLYIKKGVELSPIITGGGQESGLRSGTENTASIIGFAKAIEVTEKKRSQEVRRIKSLQTYFIKELKKLDPKIELNGSSGKRIVNNINIYLPGLLAEEVLVYLDLHGVAASSGSACTSRSIEPSYVLTNIGFSEKRVKSSIRFSLGRGSTKKDVDRVASLLKTL